MAEGKYELGKTHRYRQSGPHRQLEDHRRHRRSAGDLSKSSPIWACPPAPRHAPLRSDSIYSRQSEEAKTGCQREPTA